uniref:Uncharacterized protein n=1 Tax=Dulem virus 109 TaxID=3145586 RepID=A0AAU8AWA7_9VIRU
MSRLSAAVIESILSMFVCLSPSDREGLLVELVKYCDVVERLTLRKEED